MVSTCDPLLLKCKTSIMLLIFLKRVAIFQKVLDKFSIIVITSKWGQMFFIAFFQHFYVSGLCITFHSPDTLSDIYQHDRSFLLLFFWLNI